MVCESNTNHKKNRGWFTSLLIFFTFLLVTPILVLSADELTVGYNSIYVPHVIINITPGSGTSSIILSNYTDSNGTADYIPRFYNQTWLTNSIMKQETSSMITINGNLNTTGFGQFKWIDELANTTAIGNPPANTLRLYVENIKGFNFYKFIDNTSLKKQLGRDNIMLVKNNEGVTIPINRFVYASGTEEEIITVKRAKADSIETMPSIGITVEAIENGSYGRVMFSGIVENIDTNLPTLAFEVGSVLYVSDVTAGLPKTTPPLTPNLTQSMGTVLVVNDTIGAVQVVTGRVTGNEFGTIQDRFYIGNGSNVNYTLYFGGTQYLKWNYNLDKFEFSKNISAPNLGGTGNVSGDGTVEYIPLFSGQNTLTDSTLHVDENGTYSDSNLTITGQFKSLYYNVTDTEIRFGKDAGKGSTTTHQTSIGARTGESSSGAFGTSLGSGSGIGSSGNYQTNLGAAAGKNMQGDFVISIGYRAGDSQLGNNVVCIGDNSAEDNTANALTAIGSGAGRYNTGSSTVAVGGSAGYRNTGNKLMALGYQAGYNNTKGNMVALGYRSGYYNHGVSPTLVGYLSGNYNRGNNIVAVGGFAGNRNNGSNALFLGFNSGAYNILSNIGIIGSATMPLSVKVIGNLEVHKDIGTNIQEWYNDTGSMVAHLVENGTFYGKDFITTSYYYKGDALDNIMQIKEDSLSTTNGDWTEVDHDSAGDIMQEYVTKQTIYQNYSFEDCSEDVCKTMEGKTIVGYTNETHQGISLDKSNAMLLKAIKELVEKNEQQDILIQDLFNRIKVLEKK